MAVHDVPGFGARLKALREAAELSQPALAELAGTHYTTIAKLEAGDRSPTLGLAVALAEALGVSVVDLVPNPPLARNRRKLLAALRAKGSDD
jgi:transcriptional regulator with XRE-family HTH domain